MDNQAISYRDLLHPLTPEDFFDQYYGTKPVHIPGDAEKLARIFSWDELNRLLNMSRLWTGKSLKMALDGRNLQPEEFCYPGVTADGYRAMRPDPHRVTELLRRGATVVLDSLETLSPGIAGVAGTLAVVAGGAPTCNAYCSWNEHKGFVAHYDVDDVWALHFEGRKTWRVYEGRFEHPMEIPGFQCESLTPEQREQAKGKVLMEVDMTPGDVLYIPKGQYHDALASSEATLHLSFSVTQVTGHDFMRQLLQDLPEEPLFRQDLPHFDDIAAIEAHLGRLADRLREIITLPETADRLSQYQRQSALQNQPANFALPAREQAALYRVRSLGTKLVRRGGGWLLTTGSGRETLSADEAEVARWVLDRDCFNAATLARTFDDHDAAALAPVVEKLIGAGLIQPL